MAQICDTSRTDEGSGFPVGCRCRSREAAYDYSVKRRCWPLRTTSGRTVMRKLVVAEFMSLDGVMQAPGGAEEDTEGGFAYGGWTGPYWHDDIGAHILQ